MENVMNDQTIKVFIGVSIALGVINATINIIKYLEEREIARKKLEKSK